MPKRLLYAKGSFVVILIVLNLSCLFAPTRAASAPTPPAIATDYSFFVGDLDSNYRPVSRVNGYLWSASVAKCYMNVRYLADVPEVVYVSRFYGPDGRLVDEGTMKSSPRKTGETAVWTFATDKVSKVQNNIGIWRLELYLGTNLMFIEYFSVGVYLFDVSVTGLSSSLATKIFVDGKEAGSIRGGERKPSALAIGTHTISVSSLVEVSSDLRYTCDKNSCTVSSEGFYTFEYLVAGATQTVTGPPFPDPTNDLFDENGKPVTAEPCLDIVLVDYRRSGSNYIFELTFNGALPDRADPSFWIDWGIMINSDKNEYTGWGGSHYNNLGADLFIRLGMGKSGIVPQICELAPSFRVVDKPDCKIEGSKITFTVTSSIGTLIDSGCPWIAVARKWDQSGQTERFVAGDKAPNEGYYKTLIATVQTVTTTTTKIISGLDRAMGVEVNPNTELLSIVLSMTSWGQRFPPVRVVLGYKYQDEIEQWFSKFKIHPAVTIAQQLTDSGFAYDASVNFVLHFGPPPKMEKLYPYDDYLVGRAGGVSILDSFADALRGFAEASRFMDFYNSHADLYNSILSAYKDLDMRTLVYTLERFYGDQKRGYQIIVGASMPRAGGGYGATIQTDRGDICYFVYRASSPLYSTASLYSLGLHEFSHSFVNPMVAQFRGDVDRLRYLLDPVSRQMSDMAYGTFETMLDETIIRAFESLQSTMEFGPSTGTSRLMSEMRQGFYFVDTVYNHLVEYLYNIDSYKTFASYLPKIFAEIGKITPQEAQKKASESLSSPSPSLKSAPIPAVTISLVVKSPSLTIDDSSNVRLEMRNTGAIDIYARTVVSITQNLRLLNESAYGIILRRNETQSLNLAIKGTGPIGVASLGVRVFYSSRLLDDKTCTVEITSPRATTTETTATRALLPDASLLIIVGGGVVVAIGSFIALRKRRKTAPLARAN